MARNKNPNIANSRRVDTGRSDVGTENPRRPFDLEVRIGDTVVHRSPAGVARSLRYLLAGGELPARLSVTSAIHGEGVTSISRTLAALIAHDWRVSTCWVDLNWWKSGQPNDENGLFATTMADVVDGLGTVSELPVPTSIAGLSLITSGDVPISSRFKFPKSDQLASTIEELARTFEYVVFDLPPVLVSSDALTLGNLTDGYLLVVRQRATPKAQVGAALRTMNTVPCLGTILNDTRTRVPRWLLTSNEMWAFGDRT